MIYAFSTIGLQDDETSLFKPVCQSLPLDLQSPISVSLLKKVMVRENELLNMHHLAVILRRVIHNQLFY